MPVSSRALVAGLSRVLAAGKQGKMAGEELARTRTQQDDDRARAAVRAALEERLLTGNLAGAETTRQRTATRDTQIAQAAARIRQNPRYKTLWDLPDEDLVDAVGKVEVERVKPHGYTNTPQAEVGRRFRAVSTQIDDTARDLAAARRGAPKRPSLGFETPADSSAFARDSSAAAGRVSGLEERADSLRGVSDSLSAVLEGGAAPRRPINAAKRRITQDQADYLRAVGQWDAAKYEVVP
jgi:hypothetical protein